MHQPGSALTIAHARAELEAGLAAIARGETSVDLGAVSEVDSSAVATVLAWQRAARQQGHTLKIVSPPASLQSLARLYGVHGLIGTQVPAPPSLA